MRVTCSSPEVLVFFVGAGKWGVEGGVVEKGELKSSSDPCEALSTSFEECKVLYLDCFFGVFDLDFGDGRGGDRLAGTFLISRATAEDDCLKFAGAAGSSSGRKKPRQSTALCSPASCSAVLPVPSWSLTEAPW